MALGQLANSPKLAIAFPRLLWYKVTVARANIAKILGKDITSGPRTSTLRLPGSSTLISYLVVNMFITLTKFLWLFFKSLETTAPGFRNVTVRKKDGHRSFFHGCCRSNEFLPELIYTADHSSPWDLVKQTITVRSSKKGAHRIQRNFREWFYQYRFACLIS